MSASSNQPYDQKNPFSDKDSGEISLNDIVTFLIQSWKKLALASLLGALIGLGSWFFLAGYQAQMVLQNNSSATVTSGNTSTSQTTTYALDLISWRTIQKSLPNLADQMVEGNKVPDGKDYIFREMARVEWWQKNVIPTFALSKSDTKELAAISKEFDSASSTILSLGVSANGATRARSLENVQSASQFLLSGGAYIQIKGLFNAYENELVGAEAEAQKRINFTEIELSYLRERLKRLEDLLRRFPADQRAAQQVVDPKDSGAKYLPISTQIIAVNSEINASHETLERLKARVSQIKVLKEFVLVATPLVENNLDGILLSHELLGVEDGLRKQLESGDLTGRSFLDQLRARLLGIQGRFTKGLESNTAPNAKKTGMIKATAAGLFIAFFLTLLGLLGQGLWKKMRANKAALVW